MYEKRLRKRIICSDLLPERNQSGNFVYRCLHLLLSTVKIRFHYRNTVYYYLPFRLYDSLSPKAFNGLNLDILIKRSNKSHYFFEHDIKTLLCSAKFYAESLPSVCLSV